MNTFPKLDNVGSTVFRVDGPLRKNPQDYFGGQVAYVNGLGIKDGEEQIRFANLFAAAPDLLAALEAVRDGFFASLLSASEDAPRSEDPSVMVPVSMIDDTVELMGAAIKTAKGE